jgi:hypothetical protein
VIVNVDVHRVLLFYCTTTRCELCNLIVTGLYIDLPLSSLCRTTHRKVVMLQDPVLNSCAVTGTYVD